MGNQENFYLTKMGFKMRFIIFIIIINLTGCVGISLYKTEEENIENKQSINNNHPINGSLILNKRIDWCGIVLWPILPIPFLLPVCKSYDEENYVNNIRVESTHVFVKENFYGCGPSVWLSRIWSGNGELIWDSNGELKFCDRI